LLLVSSITLLTLTTDNLGLRPGNLIVRKSPLSISFFTEVRDSFKRLQASRIEHVSGASW
jgi:hypothetical protein